MSYAIPNNADTPSRTQNSNGLSPLASPDAGDFKIVADGLSGAYAVVSGCAVTAQGSPNMTVAVATGVVQENQRQIAVTAGNVTIASNATSNPRLDLIVVDTTYAVGVPIVIQGTVGSGSWPASGWPVWPAIPAHRVVLALVFVEASDTTISTDQIIDKRVLSIEYGSTTIELGVDGLQDYKRYNSRDLQHFYRTIGERLVRPTNVLGLGDSMMEGYGVTDDTQKWWWQWREGLQGLWRNGGVGFVNARHGVTWPYPTNPDGNNTWTLTSLVDQNYYGFGLGDRTAWLGTANGSTATISVSCDQFYLTFTSGSVGTATIDIDASTAYAQTFTFNTADASMGMSGRIYESPVLPVGIHTVKVTSTTASSTVFLEGIAPFVSDKTVGVHFWDSAHSGVLAQYFDPAVTDSRGAGASAWWGDIFYQPTAAVRSTTGVGNGTTTFTDASGAFVANDVGELITGGNSGKIPYGTRITAFGSATSVTLSNAVASGTGIAYEVQRANFTDGVTYVGATTAANGNTTVNSTTITSASNPFNAASVGSTVSGTNIPTGAIIVTVNSASSAVISQPATATGTTSTFTITASSTLSSATAAFVAWDAGKKVLGTNVPAGSYIKRVISSSLVQLSNLSTGTGTTLTFRVQNRVKYPVQPDLIVVELGLNDMKYSITSAAYKTNIINMVQHAINRGGLDYTPSVMLLGLWAPGLTFNWQDVTAVTSNGSPTMTNSNGDYGQDMVGLSVTGTNIPGGATVSSVQSSTSLTLSANATGNVAGTAVFANRVTQEFMWLRFRQAMQELADAQGWKFEDLYSLYGFIGTGDTGNFTFDLIHPNNAGSRTIADHINLDTGGVSKTGYISQGVMDVKGDIPVGTGSDTYDKLNAGIDGQVLTAASGASYHGKQVGLIYADPLMKSRAMFTLANKGLATFTDVGWPGTIVNTLTGGGTAATNDQTSDAFVKMPTLTTSGNAMGRKSADFTHFDPRWYPEIGMEIFTDTDITNIRFWFGFFSAAPETAASPAASIAAFRYDTGAPDTTGKWSTVTKDGTTLNANNSKTPTQTIAVSTRYELRICFVPVVGSGKGTNPAQVNFYVNDVLAAEHTANLPANTKTLGWQTSVTTLTSAAKAFSFGRVTVTH